MALRPALRGGLGGTSRGIIWPASFAIACTIICLGVSHSTSGPVSLSERQGPGGWHGGGASCGTLCQAKKLIMSTKKAINAQADDMIDKLQGKGDDSISKSRISSGESASHWHHNGHGRGGGAGGGSVAAHGSGGIPADARHPLAVNRLHRLWSDVHDIRKARPLFDAHKQLQERLHHHHHHHHQNARGEKDKEEKEQEEWLHSGAHIAQTPEEMKEFGRDARGENQHPDEHIDKATHVSEPPTSKMSSSIRRPAPSSAQRPATPADLANFVREVEKPGGIDTAVARIANGRANTDQQQLGTSGRACVDNPRWRSPIGDDCGKYGYGGDRSFWCSWDGASRLDACPASCGTCTRGMLKSSVEAEKAVERELSEHYDPQTLVKTKGGGASDGPSEPRKVQARREAKSRLEGEVSSLKKKLAEMAEALSRDPTSAEGSRMDMAGFYDALQRGGAGAVDFERRRVAKQRGAAMDLARSIGGRQGAGVRRGGVNGGEGANSKEGLQGYGSGWRGRGRGRGGGEEEGGGGSRTYGWKKGKDPRGRTFYYNRALGITSWKAPEALSKGSGAETATGA